MYQTFFLRSDASVCTCDESAAICGRVNFVDLLVDDVKPCVQLLSFFPEFFNVVSDCHDDFP